jgi:ABC-type nickel/cobalt efflux system permease component RcnA
MFGLDTWLAGFSDGTTLLAVALVATLLGVRHATDPDHLAAVTTLIARTEERAAKSAGRLGLAWGFGHAMSLFLFGVPIVLFEAYLPGPVQEAAETAVGVLIAGLAVWLLIRWKRGQFHPQLHGHKHLHAHEARRVRSPLQAFGIGLVHGTGGSAGVGVLLLGSIHDHTLALGALSIFAFCTALSMALLSLGFGRVLAAGRLRASFHRLAPGMALLSLAFGAWYSLGALGLTPYFF